MHGTLLHRVYTVRVAGVFGSLRMGSRGPSVPGFYHKETHAVRVAGLEVYRLAGTLARGLQAKDTRGTSV